jgi:hypothetical protein
MPDLVRRLEALLADLRRDPMQKVAAARDAVDALVRETGEPAAIRARIVAEADGTENEAYWGALDSLLERVPPAADWILQGDVYRPGERTVISRALALGALIQQYEYERLIRESREDAERDEERADEEIVAPDLMREARRHRWLVLTRLQSLFSEEERTAIETEPGTWSDAQCAEASWRSEAFGVVAWALGLIPAVPRYDESFDDEQLLDVYEDLLEGKAVAQLRGWDDLTRAARRAEEWHARGKDIARADRKALARASRPDADDAEPADGDMALFGKPYFALDDDELDHARCIAYQRRYATAWLLGGHFAWDAVPTHEPAAAALVN